jgi:hypothetical protein
MARRWRRWRANSVLRINELSDGHAQGVAADRVAGTANARRARMHDARPEPWPEREWCADQSAAVPAQRRPAGGRCCAATAAFDASSFSSSDVSIRTSSRSQSATNEANRSSPSSVRRACSSTPAGLLLSPAAALLRQTPLSPRSISGIRRITAAWYPRSLTTTASDRSIGGVSASRGAGARGRRGSALSTRRSRQRDL